MKFLLYPLTLFFGLLFSISSSASIKDSSLAPLKYGSLFVNISGDAFNTTGTPLYVIFPYASKNSAGVITTQQFTGHLSNPYIYPIPDFGGGISYGWCRLYMAGRANVALTTGSGNYSFEIGYNSYFSLLHNSTMKMIDKKLVISPFIRVAYYVYNNVSIGQINNQNLYVYTLGNTANSTYTQNVSKTYVTEDAKILNVDYAQHNWFLCPGIKISTQPVHKTTQWSLNVGYYLSFSQVSGIELVQDNINKVASMVPFGTYSLISTQNGKNTLNPYPVSGFYLSITVGWLYSNSDPDNSGTFYTK